MNIILFFILITATSFARGPYPFYDVQSGFENKMTVINRGEAALQLRINLIRQAKVSIDVEYFIYKTDMAGKILTRELVAAARRGVKVRMLLDKIPAMKTVNYYIAKVLSEEGIEVRYYNTASLLKIKKVQYRNHRKLLIIDGFEAITGGRNIGDEYFSLSSKYNFEDRDVLVQGPLVKAMRDSFEAYFAHEVSHVPKDVRKEKKLEQARKFLEQTDEERAARRKIMVTSASQLKNLRAHSCPEATFSSDAPGGGPGIENYTENYRHLQKTLEKKMRAVDQEISISSPYFIVNKRNRRIFDDLLEKKVKINVYTNSLKSADKIYMVAVFYLRLKSWIKKGMNFFIHDGSWADVGSVIPFASTTRWGTHSKTHIYETSNYTEVMIGTYNIDNRSDHYNNELAVFCKGNDEFTEEVKDDFFSLTKKGITINSDRKGVDRNGKRINITGAKFFNSLKMKAVTVPSVLMTPLL